MGHKIVEKDIPVGTWGNKYDTKNPIKKYLLDKFLDEISTYVGKVAKNIEDITEFGCGEGHLASYISDRYDEKKITATDFSEQIIKYAKEQNPRDNIEYKVVDIYNPSKKETADLILCCEVMEHLEEPEKALESIKNLGSKYVILSVPNEPAWRIVQFLSGNNIKELGNTPGHINHWSSKAFVSLVSNYFDVVQVSKPFPWTVLLVKNK